jgi:antitoxin CptB
MVVRGKADRTSLPRYMRRNTSPKAPTMTGSVLSSAELEPLRKKLLFRAWHRGIREMDLILGRFADTHIAGMEENELEEFAFLLEVFDRDLIQWFTGETETPMEWNTVLFRKIKQYHMTADQSS